MLSAHEVPRLSWDCSPSRVIALSLTNCVCNYHMHNCDRLPVRGIECTTYRIRTLDIRLAVLSYRVRICIRPFAHSTL